MKRSIASLSVVAAMALSAASANAALQLIQFSPLPLSPGVAEFQWTGAQYTHGPGNLGNGDGAAAVGAQTPGGLQVDTPFIIPAVAGSVVDVGSGLTSFYDVTFTTTGLNAAGNATTFINLGQTIQPLTSGTFTMLATDGTVLLTGLLSNSSLSVPTGSTSSAAQSATVTYTGGLIYAAAQAAGFAQPAGSASISMVSVGGPVVVTPVPLAPIVGVFPLQSQSSTINPFQADATGVFDLIPEPGSMGVLALGSLLLGRRRRA